MNNKQRARKYDTRVRTIRKGEFRIMLDFFWSVLEMEIEEPGCQG